jgi:acetyl-CoA acetyltransferase
VARSKGKSGNAFNDVAIVGVGQTPYHKNPELPTLWYLVEAVRLALANAGLEKNDVDGLAVSSFLLPPDNTATVAEQMGMELRWGYLGAFGGAAHVIGVLRAAHAIQQGEAEVIVVVAADAFSVASHHVMMNSFNTGMRDYLAPYGMGGTTGLFAMLERRHSYEFGTTREQLGKIAVIQRANACLNPNALFRTPMSLDDYLNARLICDPLRLYDCPLPCGGGEAVVLTTTERAKKLRNTPIRILAGGERTNHRPDDFIMLESGWSQFATQMFSDAGLKHSDVDLVEVYDDYPIMVVIQLEDLGFCAKGDGGRFVADTDISLHGSLPLNTGGGQLSCGQSGAGGGGLGLTEAVIQLQGAAGERQVKDAEVAVVSGFGMVGFVKGLCQSSVILTNE